MNNEWLFTTQAKARIVRVLTNERKKMSTKTTFKRIALVAVVALGLGGLSTVPASAAGDATAIVVSNTTTAAGTALSASKYTADKVLLSTGISAFSVVAGSAVVLKVKPVGTFDTSDRIRVSMRGYGYVVGSSALAATATGVDATLPSFTATTIPGTYYLDVAVALGGTFAASTDLNVSVAMTVTAADGLSASLSTAYSVIGNGTSAATSTTNLVPLAASKSLAATNVGAITVSMIDAVGAAMASGNTITATVTGPGYISWSTADAPVASSCPVATTALSATLGKFVSAQTADAVGTLYVCADGTSGVGSIKIEMTDAFGVKQTLATKTVTFYGTVSKLAVTKTNYTIGYAGGDITGADTSALLAARTAAGELLGPLTALSTTPAFVVTTSDSSGVAAGTVLPTIVSSNTAVVASGLCARDDAATTSSSSTNGIGVFNCAFTTAISAKSGDKATLTVRTPDPASTTGGYLTATVDVTVGGDPYKETLTFDKTAYVPGEAMIITRTAVDDKENPVADGSAAPSVVFNKATGGSTSVAAGIYVAGKSATSSTKPTIFAPTVGGKFEGRMTGYNSSTTSSQITGTSSVVGDAAADSANAATDAANEATDAANAATDAALAAADAADAATAAAQDASDAVAALSATVAMLVASLKAQITSLTNLVIKIQKKVKA